MWQCPIQNNTKCGLFVSGEPGCDIRHCFRIVISLSLTLAPARLKPSMMLLKSWAACRSACAAICCATRASKSTSDSQKPPGEPPGGGCSPIAGPGSRGGFTTAWWLEIPVLSLALSWLAICSSPVPCLNMHLPLASARGSYEHSLKVHACHFAFSACSTPVPRRLAG